jgi:L-ascorbate oxidase
MTRFFRAQPRMRLAAPTLLLSTCCCAVLAWPGIAAAQAGPSRVVADPPRLQLIRKAARPPAGLQLEALALPAATSHEASLDLNVVYTDGQIWNPATQRFDKVKLRSYQGKQVDPQAPFVSPMLEVKPGDTIRIRLNNQLPPFNNMPVSDPGDANCAAPPSDNTPHCFNGTNLHTHGLWVNPAGNGDNVLLSINPGISFEYEYNIPSDHPAGTYWYHTHRHGSTALQVASGMAGALIIRGDRTPTTTAPGDLDTLLTSSTSESVKERVLVLQQIQYACRDANGVIKRNADKTYKCDPTDVGGVKNYDDFAPTSWATSGRYTSINGQVLPWFGDARAGRLERWRLIHGGIRDTVHLQLRKLKPSAPSPQALKAAEQSAFVAENCTGDPVPLFTVAADGLTTAAATATPSTVLQPGYRWDLLLNFPEAGNYCVMDLSVQSSASVSQLPTSRQLLGLVRVDAGTAVAPTPSAYLTEQLVALATTNMPAAARDLVVADLRNGLKLNRFVPHATVTDQEVTGSQFLAFNIVLGGGTPLFQVNGRSFEPGRVDRVLTIGNVDEWVLRSDLASHPFHIHVNPFQVVRILDPNGKDVSGPDAVDDWGGTVDPQYRGLKGTWKDTLWVKNGGPGGRYTLFVRTRYERYIGDFVLHCHILDHEDQGMMQHIRIALPGADNQGVGHAH